MFGIKKTGFAVFSLVLAALISIAAALKADAAAEPGCSATLSPDLKIHIPVVSIEGNLFSVDFELVGTSGDLIELGLLDAQPTTRDCKVQAALSVDTSIILHIPSLIYGADDYSLSLEFVSTGESVALGPQGGRGSLVRESAANKRTLYRFKIVKGYLIRDVWRGASTCTFYSKFTPGDGSIQERTDVTTGSAVFVRSGGLGTILPWDEKWELVDGYVSYTWDQTDTHYRGNCWSTIKAGPVSFPMKTPRLEDNYLQMRMDPADSNSFLYQGIGNQTMPGFKLKVHEDCPGVPGWPRDDIADVPKGTMAPWLATPPESRALLGTTTLSGKGVISSITLAEVTMTNTCEWSFTYSP